VATIPNYDDSELYCSQRDERAAARPWTHAKQVALQFCPNVRPEVIDPMALGQAVTVVIPAFNAAQFIARAIEDVLAQTHLRIELIIVDDGSTDGTGDVARGFADPRITVLSGPNEGVGAARNKGLRVARGDFVAFLDADDAWLPDKLGAQLRVFDSEPSYVAVGSFLRYESMAGTSIGVAGQVIKVGDRESIAQGFLMPFPISSVVFRRHVLELIGGFDEALSKSVPGLVEDLDLMARVARLGPIGCVDRVLGSYRVHGGSASARHFSSQRMGSRFVRARLAAEARGETLSLAEFAAAYEPTLRQRYGDTVSFLYRRAGLAAAEGRRLSALGYGLLACLVGPRYALRRALRQRLGVGR
jgi:glycosyltransferase involved in cell wall biosynthesis